jgi:hypothetical protein
LTSPRGGRFEVPLPQPSCDCTIEAAVLAPNGGGGLSSSKDEDKIEIFQYVIDPREFPGGYAGLTHRLNSTQSYK